MTAFVQGPDSEKERWQAELRRGASKKMASDVAAKAAISEAGQNAIAAKAAISDAQIAIQIAEEKANILRAKKMAEEVAFANAAESENLVQFARKIAAQIAADEMASYKRSRVLSFAEKVKAEEVATKKSAEAKKGTHFPPCLYPNLSLSSGHHC